MVIMAGMDTTGVMDTIGATGIRFMVPLDMANRIMATTRIIMVVQPS